MTSRRTTRFITRRHTNPKPSIVRTRVSESGFHRRYSTDDARDHEGESFESGRPQGQPAFDRTAVRAATRAKANEHLFELAIAFLTLSNPYLLIHDLERQVAARFACECLVEMREDLDSEPQRAEHHAGRARVSADGVLDPNPVDSSVLAPLVDHVMRCDRSLAIGLDGEDEDLGPSGLDVTTLKMLAPDVRWVVAAPIHRGGVTAGAVVLLGARGDEPPWWVEIVERLAVLVGASFDNWHAYVCAQEALHVRDDVLAIVSHELKNPLGVILMGTASILRRTQVELDAAFLQREVEAIQRNARRMKILIADLLDYGSIQAGRLSMNPVPCRPDRLVDEAIAETTFAALDRGVALVVTDANRLHALPDVCADPDRVEQVLINLVGNAIKFTRRGGKVTVSASLTSASASDERSSDAVLFTVTDTGIGIAEDALPHVFERYWKASSAKLLGAGSGLGLAISKSLVELSGGRIWVESTLGNGTKVSFTVPVARDIQALPHTSE